MKAHPVESRGHSGPLGHRALVSPRERTSCPTLMTPDEVATLLRTSRRAVYAMVERAQLPGVIRIGRRVLLREADLLDWLRQKSTPSPER